MTGRLTLLFVALTSATLGQIESVVKVCSPIGNGSGWVGLRHSDRDGRTYWGLVVTAKHCVFDDYNNLLTTTCKFSDGFESQSCGVAAYDSDDDIALVWCIVPESVKPMRLGKCSWPGSKVFNFGLAREGLDEGFIDVHDLHSVYWHGTVTAGDSGGPLCDAEGNVVAVVVNKTWDSIAMLTYRGGGVAVPVIEKILAVGSRLSLPDGTTRLVE